MALAGTHLSAQDRFRDWEPLAPGLRPGTNEFVFLDRYNGKSREIRVWYYRPPPSAEEPRILFVIHGVNRNPDKYRDDWRGIAAANNVLLLVPDFSEEMFPGGRAFSTGNMFLRDGRPIGRAEWSFSVLERLFDHVTSMNESSIETYDLYGHSAGGQFVHRFVMFMTDARFEKAVAANAGWYTVPDQKIAFPYGVSAGRLPMEDLGKALGRRLTVLLGENDTNPNDSDLNNRAEARAQGRHRLERGLNFFEAAKRRAASMGVELRWSLKTVPGVGHSNRGMSRTAAAVLYPSEAHATDRTVVRHGHPNNSGTSGLPYGRLAPANLHPPTPCLLSRTNIGAGGRGLPRAGCPDHAWAGSPCYISRRGLWGWLQPPQLVPFLFDRGLFPMDARS